MLTIATGDKKLNEIIEGKYEKSHVLQHEDDLKYASSYLVWSSFLIRGNMAEQKGRVREWLHYFKQTRVQTVLIAPREWQEDFQNECRFIPVHNGNFSLTELYSAIDLMLESEQVNTDVFTFGADVVLEDETVEEQTTKKKVFAFWSVKPGMGVSTLTHILANQLAMSGVKTLLIEWDMLYPSIPYSIGLSDSRRCLERWITDVEGGLEPQLSQYVLNKTLWLEQNKEHLMRKTIEKLPSNLYVLAPSNELKPSESFGMQVDTAIHTLRNLNVMDFEAVIIDVPSELMHSATAASLKEADEAFVVVDGKGGHAVRTNLAKEIIQQDLDVSLSLILNGVTSKAVSKNIQQNLNLKCVVDFPYDNTLHDHSLELSLKANRDYMSSIRQLITHMGYNEKKQRGKVKRKKLQPRKEKYEKNQLQSFLNFS